jgi:hypothetical protein
MAALLQNILFNIHNVLTDEPGVNISNSRQINVKYPREPFTNITPVLVENHTFQCLFVLFVLVTVDTTVLYSASYSTPGSQAGTRTSLDQA